MRLGKRIISHLLSRLGIVFRERVPEEIQLDFRWPEPLEIRIASTEEDLEAAFSLLYDVYAKAGFMRPQPSRMRILPQHLLPQTSTLVARWNGKVVATVSLIRDNPMGLPMEKHFSLQEQRAGGKVLAEVSSLAIDPAFHGLNNDITFPLFRFLYQYATSCFGIQKFVIATHPRTLGLYRSLMLFEPFGRTIERYEPANGAPAVGLILDLERAPERWESAYRAVPREKNLLAYFLVKIDHPGCLMPSRQYSVASDPVITPQILERLFLRKAGLLAQLREEDFHILRDAYPHDSYDKILQLERWSDDRMARRELRLDSQMEVKITEHGTLARVRNVSRHGLQIWSEHKLRPQEVLTLDVQISEQDRALLRAQVKWADSSGRYGLRILSYSGEWSRLSGFIEDKFSVLVTATG